MKSLLALLLFSFASILLAQPRAPIQLHPDNPHYFLWRGQPTVLITAGEHYGAVLNLAFDYRRYLDELKTNRFNLTRIFSGTYREVPGSFGITGNTLAPAADHYLSPWPRSETKGATDGGNKFDLSQWDPAYFTRLQEVVTQAGQRGVVVELVLFCTMYDDALWNASPMNARNNINGIGNVSRGEVYSGRDQELLTAQKAVVKKIVQELSSFDNVYFEVCNEPYERGGLTKQWNDAIIATIVDAESTLPHPHLIAQGFPPSSAAGADLNRNVSILNFHAAKAEDVSLNYSLAKVVALDETGGSDQIDRKYRTEGWDWILAGGGVYDHLDFSFTLDRPDGSGVLPAGTPGGGGPALRRQLRILKEFMEALPFIRMKPDQATIRSNHITLLPGRDPPQPATLRALSEPGRSYAIYVKGGQQAHLVLALPAATYTAEWINTRTGASDQTETFQHAGGNKTMASPQYSEDIALRVQRQPGTIPAELATAFAPPPPYQSDFGTFRSPLIFADGTRVQKPADWPRRRAEILSTWHKLMGPWPRLVAKPRVEVLNTTLFEPASDGSSPPLVPSDQIRQQQLRIEIALGGEMVDALLLIPNRPPGAPKRPAVLVVYYDAETGVGLGAPFRDYAWQLAKRGFVTLSIGKPNALIDLTTTNKPRTEAYLGPVGKPVQVEPLSALAYAAANAHTVLAQRSDVDPARIGIVGHSFGGKWALFASCLYDKFACAVWSDPGIVFDERDRRKQNPSGSVNYWDVWYLGFELGGVADPQNTGPFRKLPTEGQPRTGAYKALLEGGHDLVELHALMAPRPFLVSGGTADLPERWPALNHSIAVNKLLGYDHRVAMTDHEGHTPTAAANDQVYRFFEWCLANPD